MALFRASRIIGAALAVGLTAAGATMASAQSSSGSPGAPPAGPRGVTPPAGAATPPAAAAASITDQELKSFAVAALEVKRINDTYRPRYQSAETPAAKQQVQQEATQKMSDAVEQKGLSVDKYNQIVRVAQADPQVAKQIDDYARQSQ